MPQPPDKWSDRKLEEKWRLLLEVKAEASKALEGARKAKLIGHPLDALVTIFDKKGHHKDVLLGQEQTLKEILVVSTVDIVGKQEEEDNVEGVFNLTSTLLAGLEVSVRRAAGDKCARCWHYSESVGEEPSAPTICARCREALRAEGE